MVKIISLVSLGYEMHVPGQGPFFVLARPFCCSFQGGPQGAWQGWPAQFQRGFGRLTAFVITSSGRTHEHTMHKPHNHFTEATGNSKIEWVQILTGIHVLSTGANHVDQIVDRHFLGSLVGR